MNILKKTNGIDLRAKGTALQGHVKIQLKDDTTGRIVEEVEHKNFFTKALDSPVEKTAEKQMVITYNVNQI